MTDLFIYVELRDLTVQNLIIGCVHGDLAKKVETSYVLPLDLALTGFGCSSLPYTTSMYTYDQVDHRLPGVSAHF